jgi:DNA-binding GntR family transcriptional regulator
MASTLANTAYTHIRLGLLRGDFPPGTPLREVQLSREAGVSRGPIREAFQRLEDEGLVEQIPNRGAFARVPTVEEFEDLMDTRIALEGVAIRKACARITRPQLAQLRKILVRAARATLDISKATTQADREACYLRWAITDIEFHQAIYEASHNPMLGKFVARCHVLSRFWAHAAVLMHERPAATVREGTRDHIRIYHAIKADQPKLAASLLTSHIEVARLSHDRASQLPTCPALPDAMARAIVEVETNFGSQNPR